MQDPKSSFFSSIRRWSIWGLLIPFAFTVWIFTVQPDRLAALSVVPVECWCVAGILLQIVCWKARKRSAWRTVSVLWCVLLVFWIEPVWSCVRLLEPVAAVAQGDRRLCVVSLNCHAGSRNVLADLRAQSPDLILLQESPGRHILEKWSVELFGDEGAFLNGPDCSIIARGKLTRQQSADEAAFIAARWTDSFGQEFDVISLRLWPQPFRMDYWNPDCWSGFAEVRRIQRSQVDSLRMVVAQREAPLILGGDFNCPAGDVVERPLFEAGLQETFRSSGRGWGKTILNNIPFHRIDRLWFSSEFVPVSTIAVQTVGSDHRLVRCDVDLKVIAR